MSLRESYRGTRTPIREKIAKYFTRLTVEVEDKHDLVIWSSTEEYLKYYEQTHPEEEEDHYQPRFVGPTPIGKCAIRSVNQTGNIWDLQ